jgi:putative pyruvate formate lyase activating enzyme
VQNSIRALTMLYVEFGKELPVSVMSQYHPVRRHPDENLNRFLSPQEFDRVLAHARGLGFRHMYVQFPEQVHPPAATASAFLPDFRHAEPFQPS